MTREVSNRFNMDERIEHRTSSLPLISTFANKHHHHQHQHYCTLQHLH